MVQRVNQLEIADLKLQISPCGLKRLVPQELGNVGDVHPVGYQMSGD